MALIDFFIKKGLQQLDNRNVIRTMLVGWAEEEQNPRLVLNVIRMIKNELEEAGEEIRRRLSGKNKNTL